MTSDNTKSKHGAMMMELNEEIDRLIPKVQDYGTFMSKIEGLGWQKISRAMHRLNSAINQFDLFVNYGIVYLTTAEFTFFSIAHKIFVTGLHPNY